MANELGKKLSKNFIRKIATNIFLTQHSAKRIKERSDLWVEDDFNKTMWNVNFAISHCKFAYSNNDGTISVVIKDGLSFIVSFNDETKRWNIITIKGRSENGITNYEKMKIAQQRVGTKYKVKESPKSRGEHRFKEKMHKEKYKRDNSWKGEEW